MSNGTRNDSKSWNDIDATGGKDSRSGGKTRRKKGRNTNRGRGNTRSKEMEVNIPDASINKADLPHVVSSSRADNDPNWYMHIYPAVLDVASLPFNIPLGTHYDNLVPGVTSNPAIVNSNYSTVQPGIMVLRLAPTAGVSDTPTSPINIAAQQIYALDRQANSGAKNYDKTDLMMLIQAMDSAYMLYEELVRMYKTFHTVDYMSRYMPDTLLYAEGFSPSLAGSLADIRAAINYFAYKLASINVPDQFDFIHRHSWLFENVYVDSKGATPQMYLYKPDGYYQWTEGTDDEPTSLRYIGREALYGASSGTVSDISQITSAINNLLDPILGSEDAGIISGDLAKAFGANGMIKIQPIVEHEMLNLAYSPEVLHQVMNAMPLGVVSNNNITQDLSNTVVGPQLVCRPAIVPSNQTDLITRHKKLLNFHDYPHDQAGIMVATRLTFSLGEAFGTNQRYLASCGTEICVSVLVYYDSIGIASNPTVVQLTMEMGNVGNLNLNLTTALRQVAARSKFDYAPTAYLWNTESDQATYYGEIQDVDDYTYIDDSIIQKLHEAAIMSEYAVKDWKALGTKS